MQGEDRKDDRGEVRESVGHNGLICHVRLNSQNEAGTAWQRGREHAAKPSSTSDERRVSLQMTAVGKAAGQQEAQRVGLSFFFSLKFKKNIW